ncbi:IS701 family transposase [Streptomyces sp. NPDC007264]|uniref:IS701 family transposase n=1 Tax=Streptomyces sp. NPDC007264 TaxID=3364777 RepID=UPI0036DEF829
MISLFFESLPRRDQRRWARVYLNGLVSTAGKKTIRNIAGADAGSVEQSLQQFISKSPWDWTPVRRSLAQHLERSVQRPLAWVVQPVIIEKAGDRSVGVGRQFVPQLGRMANCQQATGVWLASSEAGFPVEWSLTLPGPWTSELLRRRRAGIPDTARSRTPAQDAVHTVLRMAEAWQLQRRPVVMEVSNADLPQTMETFMLYGIPFVLKVDGSLPVALATPGSHKPALYTTSARELIDSLRSQRRLVEWPRHGRADGAVTPLAAAAVHATPGEDRTAASAQPLVLFGAWAGAANPLPSEFWVTNIQDMPLAQLFLLAKLTDRVALDFDDVCEAVGIRDFEGRSFRGWHHHMTLASVAHAATLLASRPRTSPHPAARVGGTPAPVEGASARVGGAPARVDGAPARVGGAGRLRRPGRVGTGGVGPIGGERIEETHRAGRERQSGRLERTGPLAGPASTAVIRMPLLREFTP